MAHPLWGTAMMALPWHGAIWLWQHHMRCQWKQNHCGVL